MTHARLNHLLGRLQCAAAGPPSDGELLSRFIERREEGAFAALVRRHGPMVLGVCLRVLGNPHDAEDAFQATFLVLARKAASLRLREAVAGWLHGVACRTALAARKRRARLQRHEKQLSQVPEMEARAADPWAELRPLLDYEVHRLPDIYRQAVVLCDLEGQSRKAAAEQLGVPEGTLSSRLAAARKRLTRRLSRHGTALTAGALAVLLGKNAAASVPAALGAATTRAALLAAAGRAAAVSGTVATLTEGVLKTMFLAKVKTVTVVLLGVTVLGLGTGKLYYAAGPDTQGPRVVAQDRADQSPDARKPVTDARTQQASAEQERALDRARQLEQAQRAARDQERQLREELERLRKEVEAQRDRAEAARQRAEEERQKAEAVRQQAESRLQEARAELRQALEKAAEDAAKRQAQRYDTGWQPQQGGPGVKMPRVPDNVLQSLRASADKLREDFLARREHIQGRLKKLEAEREQLEAQLKQLEAQARQDLESLQQKHAEIVKQHESRPGRDGNRAPAGGDKLDRILDKLERLERRIDLLERGGNQGQ